MRYMMLICEDESVAFTEEEDRATMAAIDAWVQEMNDRNVRVQGNRLRPVSDATTIKVRDGEVLLADGPFAEAKEQIAGFDIIDCANLDEAIEVAAKHPVAAFGTIEVRPLLEA
ncbi:YciI family protein [Micromonospora sp. KC723]|uniref:YciI family protein n=1 Tax=Micromonospora sp. KC723 TaxID=2530381 RepID=UPI0010530852|nr:YciI family protein [Micromonospora sp. KC723]TDB75485.1 transcription initiation protein [Micromonospora sp. KC723]